MHLLFEHLSAQIKVLIRTPAFWVPTVLLPGMLYAFFGAVFTRTGSAALTAAASFAAYGVMSVSFFQFGVGIAQDRDSPWDSYLRLLPQSGFPRTSARILAAAIFSLISAALVIAIAEILAAVRLEAIALIKLVAVCLVTSLTFAVFGVALGYWCSSRTAVAFANLILLPLAYLGGLWVPPAILPPVVRSASNFTPTRHVGELAWAAVLNQQMPLPSMGILAFYTALVAALAYAGYKRDLGRRYG